VVFAEADDGESAGVVGGLGRADVEEARAVWKFDYIIDMRFNADVFVEVLLGVFDGDAGAGFGGVRGERRYGECKDELDDSTLGHGSFRVCLLRGSLDRARRAKAGPSTSLRFAQDDSSIPV